jgi:hypothetical protein
MFYYNDIFYDNRTLPYLLDTVSSSQVMSGSDCPFMWRDQMPQEEFDALSLIPAEREAVGSGNCLRCLGLARRSAPLHDMTRCNPQQLRYNKPCACGAVLAHTQRTTCGEARVRYGKTPYSSSADV